MFNLLNNYEKELIESDLIPSLLFEYVYGKNKKNRSLTLHEAEKNLKKDKDKLDLFKLELLSYLTISTCYLFQMTKNKKLYGKLRDRLMDGIFYIMEKKNSKGYKKFLIVLFAWQSSIEKMGNFQLSYLDKLLFQRYLDNISMGLSFNIIEFAKDDIEFVIQNIFEKCPTLRSHLDEN